MWELDNKKGWVPSNWCLQILVLAKTHKNPLEGKEIKSVNTKGNKPWIFIGSTDAEAESPILWPPEVKNWLIGKDPDAGKDWSQKEKGMTEDKMVGWHHWLNGHEFEQAPRVDDGQGSLVCYSPWGCKESELAGTELKLVTELNWTQCQNWLLPNSCEFWIFFFEIFLSSSTFSSSALCFFEGDFECLSGYYQLIRGLGPSLCSHFCFIVICCWMGIATKLHYSRERVYR